MTSPLRPGLSLGRYVLQAQLGEGAMGEVWRAEHLALKKPVAVKVLHAAYAGEPTLRARFLREGEAASRVRHPHVVEVHDVGEHDGLPYLVMEFLEGECLADKLHREGALPITESVDLLLPVIAAVSSAHEVGVVHRDLKPENLFLAQRPDGTIHPKVLDFGISRVVDDRSGRVRTLHDVVLGTPPYMAPEHARGDGPVDDRCDQYALGAVLYEMLTGAMAFDGQQSPDVVLAQVARGRFRPPRALRPALPVELEAVVLRAMAFEASQRFRSLRSMGASLLAWASATARVQWARSFDAFDTGIGATLVDEDASPLRSQRPSHETPALAPGQATLVDEAPLGAQQVAIRPMAPPRPPKPSPEPHAPATEMMLAPVVRPVPRGLWIALGVVTFATLVVVAARLAGG